MLLLSIKRASVTTLLLISNISLADAVDVSGFIGVGGVKSDDQEYRNIVESGFRFSGTLPANFSLNSQILWRDHNDSMDDDPELDYATLDWQTASKMGEQKISVGRFKANGGIYSNTRDMPFARPSIQLSGVIYNEDHRSLYANIDGARLHSVTTTNLGELTTEFGFGAHSSDEELGRSIEIQGSTTRTFSADQSWLWNLKFQTMSWLVNFSYRKLDVLAEGGSNPSIYNEVSMDSYILGVQYSRGPWELTSEAILQNTAFLQSTEDQSTSGIYIQPRYFINSELAVMARAEHTIEDRNNAERKSEQTMNSYALGLSWRPSERWQLSAEIHRNSLDNTSALAQVAWRF